MTPDRRDAILNLLRTRDEHLPEPVRRTEASTGFVHRMPARVTCPDCLANDRTMFGCETCGGRGYTEKMRERDPYATDKVMPYGLDGTRHEAARERDRQLGMLDRQLARPKSAADELAEANANPYAWELARRRMWKLYDYSALDRALEQLRAVDEDASRALHAVYVYAWMPEGPAVEMACERGLVFLDERLPDPLRAPKGEQAARVRGPLRPEAGSAAKKTRDDEMRSRSADGMSAAELASEFGVSIRTVYNVVNQAA